MLISNFDNLDMDNLYIFGYGSLCYPAGINGRGMEHEYTFDELHTVILDSYKRGWYAKYNRWSFYGIILSNKHNVNGVVIKIYSKSDLLALFKSEEVGKVYEVHDVTKKIMGFPAFQTRPTILSLIALNKNCLYGNKYPYYEQDVFNGISHWGKGFVESFENTTHIY